MLCSHPLCMHGGQMPVESKGKAELKREMSLSRKCEMFSLLMNKTLSVIRTEKRGAQKAEHLMRGEALSRTYLEVLDQEFQLRGTDRPFKISTWQLRGEPS